MKFGEAEILLKKGDITQEEVDVIVNAANSSLMGGGGVDGAIHAAGGPEVLKECKEIVAVQGRCLTGEAVVTTGGNLKASKVIHTVGPVWGGGNHQEERLLQNAYCNSLRLCREIGAQSIAFPSISTGAYGFPIEKAARIALQAVRDDILQFSSPKEVRFILFSDRDFAVYKSALEGMEVG